MKFITTITFLFFPFWGFSKPQLHINVLNCNTESIEFLNEVKIFRNGIYLTGISDSLKGKSFYILKNIDTGNYQIQYENEYLMLVNQDIQIIEDKTYRLNICTNKLGDMPPNFGGLVDSITPNKPLFITVCIGGCFSTSTAELKISLKKGKLLAEYSKETTQSGKSANKIHKSKKLNLESVLAIRTFEYELSMLDFNNKNNRYKIVSTTKSLYKIYLGNISREVIDSSSSWQGFGHLIEKIF